MKIRRTITATPVYGLIPSFDNNETLLAGHLIMRDCLEGTLEYNIPDYTITNSLHSRDHQLELSVEIATEWGYPILRQPQPDWVGVRNRDSLSPEDAAEYERCGEVRAERLREPAPARLYEFAAAGWAAWENSEENEVVKQAWRECMEPQGLVDLPETPTEMPPFSMWGEPDENGNYVDIQLELTEHERAIAIADAQCRESVGYKEAEIRVRARGELEAIGKDIESFEATRAEYEEFQKALESVLAEHR